MLRQRHKCDESWCTVDNLHVRTFSRKGTPSHRALLMNIAIALNVGHRLRKRQIDPSQCSAPQQIGTLTFV